LPLSLAGTPLPGPRKSSPSSTMRPSSPRSNRKATASRDCSEFGAAATFGGQAAYLMRIFGIDGDTVTEKGLENTPDTTRLAADAA
jgi:hypothetical protein